VLGTLLHLGHMLMLAQNRVPLALHFTIFEIRIGWQIIAIHSRDRFFMPKLREMGVYKVNMAGVDVFFQIVV
jgi:hypothetical protein